VPSPELKATLENILAPMIESDKGELFLVLATDQHVILHLRGKFAGCPGNGLVAEHIITPLVQAVIPGARVDVSSGAILPDGATKISAPPQGTDHAPL
jgi:Fe-S cluster biogenesis protein NfuA